MGRLIIALFLILVYLYGVSAFADANVNERCFSGKALITHYESYARGEVTIYSIPHGRELTASDLYCAFGHQFLSSVDDFPFKAVIGVVADDLSRLQLLQWSLPGQVLTVINIDMTIEDGRKNGIFTIYPEPLERMREVFLNRPFPRREDLPLDQQGHYKVNYVSVKVDHLNKLLYNY